MASHAPTSNGRRHVVLAGGGLAALRTAEELRRRGFDGAVTMVSEEAAPPYDRPPLSKGVLAGTSTVEQAVYRKADYYKDLGIELLLGQPAGSLDLRERTIRSGKRVLAFTDLVIATGASPRRLSNVLALDGVYELRTADDALRVREAMTRNPRVVVVGAGFIGSEVAASARALKLDVTIVEASPAPLARAIGPEMGKVCAALHGDNGARLLTGVVVERVEGEGRVERIHLSDGSSIDCDLLVVGIGVKPNVEWLAGTDIPIDNGVRCDPTLQAGAPGVYAVGDVASWHNDLFGTRMRCEQWTNAVEQGRHAARNILANGDGLAPFLGSNYFWSDQYGSRIQFAGWAVADEIVVVDGSPDSRKFLAWYRSGDRLIGAISMNSPKLLMFSKTLIDARSGWQAALAALERQVVPPEAAAGTRSDGQGVSAAG